MEKTLKMKTEAKQVVEKGKHNSYILFGSAVNNIYIIIVV